ncbi:SRPBCC family protein [Streptomyces actinomycinicus]|uniref:SRPBCC family protein n=1 Tax=Streptomyces actinomycinicus TaxID=1695166 RepID=A0A937JU51_9ACTN|nr:SRPBCC family protein [Streptomyces actinomycinicus]MBL1087493.1 SRPBCC family protein [Streptomyces actinomycinicus]
MEHQVFVPAPTERLTAALADPARVVRAIPGLQQDAGAEPITGRLKLRVGGHSVTYRGTLRVLPRTDGTYAVEGEATEARGAGTVTLALTLRLTATEGGTTVTVEGTADASGRITELPADTVTAAATRLLDRCLESLTTDRQPEPDSEPNGEQKPADTGSEPAPAGESARASVFDTAVPPPSLDPDADRDVAEDVDVAEDLDEGADVDEDVDEDVDAGCSDRLTGDFADTGAPPAEAAHARRTMIGRSAEEVDHAPPRGRYAPVPAPQTVVGSPVLRWAAPAAALALASAIVVTRVLRKRR